MNTAPKISILLAVYNGENYIKECINSIISQTYKDWELLIGLNGCSDKTKEICKSYNDNRIKIFDYENDKGKAKTLNKLLKESSCEWLAMQDHDDIWLSKKLQTQINFIENNDNVDVVGANALYINKDGFQMGKPDIHSFRQNEIKNSCLEGSNQIINSSAVFKKSKVLEVGGWNEEKDIQGIEDFDLWLTLIKNQCTFANIKKIFVLHRIHSQSNFNTQKYDIQSLIDKYKENAN